MAPKTKKSAARKKTSPTKKKQPSQSKPKRRWLRWLTVIFLIGFCGYLGYLNYLINQRFDGDAWALPSRVYARDLELFPGARLSRQDLITELQLGLYQKVSAKPQPGQYAVNNNRVLLHTRRFQFADQQTLTSSRRMMLEFNQGRLESLMNPQTGEPIELARIPPVVLGSYYPGNGEDRVLLEFDQIPSRLIDILTLVEDRQFYDHWGVNPLAIARAMLVNLKAGKTVQGGSTLTQQLAKNLFLTPKRSLTRKINEAFIALILEARFSKQNILQAYLNEVFLLQQDKIAIHGFGLASRLLFKKTLDQLEDHHLALMVGMVKGPSRYNPLRNPELALARRDLVLKVMFDQNLIDEREYKTAINQPLGVSSSIPGVNPFPAYLDMVKRQINSHYSSDELKSRGLNIFTPFNPIVQLGLEKGLKKGLKSINKPDLQSAVVIADYLSGDILAMTGNSKVKYPGFNRAVLAQRPVGSLMKPLLLYSLIDNETHLGSMIEDKPISIKQSNGDIWQPRNYDRKLHGRMTLYRAFIKSYNLPFVHLGVKGGLEQLASNLQQLKLLKSTTVYPSLLLGSAPMSAFEVTQMYQTIANNGHFTPLTTIRRINSSQNLPLRQMPLSTLRLFDPDRLALVQRALIGVVEEGTARHLNNRFPGVVIGGKTGTTNDTRDSWFSGFSGRMLSVVWLGHDDNSSTGLTGSSGALRVWADIMENQSMESFVMSRNESLEWKQINQVSGRPGREGCAGSVWLPFQKHHRVKGSVTCD